MFPYFEKGSSTTGWITRTCTSREAHTEGFECYGNAALKKNKHRDNASAITANGHRRTGALKSGGKIKICIKHQTFEVIG